jgi:hypothetical protein
MTEPNASNTAQQKQDQVKPKPVKLDPLGNSTTDIPDGAVHGGEIAKPGQMDGDEDVSANLTDAGLKQAAGSTGPAEG